MVGPSENQTVDMVALAANLLSVAASKVKDFKPVEDAPQQYSKPPPQYRFNSAMRLCYCLQLVPTVNEKHELRSVPPTTTTSSSSSRRRPSTHAMPARADPELGRGRSILWLPLIFAASTYLLYLLSLGFYDERTHEKHELKFPTNLEELSQLASYLSSLKDKHYSRVLVLFIAAYVYKQTFAIPGSVFLNVLSGALFGPWHGFALTALLSAVGATSCYLLSRAFGRAYVVRYFPDKVRLFQEKAEENRDSLFFFLLFIRFFPISPNWLLNIVAPIVGIPIHLFFFSVFIGLMPYTFVCAQTGAVLSQVSSMSDVFTWRTTLSMLLAALVALLPGLAIKKMQGSSRHSNPADQCHSA